MTPRRERSSLAGWTNAAGAALWPPVVAGLLLSAALVPSDTTIPSLTLVPALAFYRWAKHAPAALVCPLAALGGGTLDVLAHGPLGFWALVYAAAAALGASGRAMSGSGALVNLALFALHIAALCGLMAGLTALCTVAVPDGRAIAGELVLAVAAYPVIVLLMGGSSAPSVRSGQ